LSSNQVPADNIFRLEQFERFEHLERFERLERFKRTQRLNALNILYPLPYHPEPDVCNLASKAVNGSKSSQN